jgi:hypothetical protein
MHCLIVHRQPKGAVEIGSSVRLKASKELAFGMNDPIQSVAVVGLSSSFSNNSSQRQTPKARISKQLSVRISRCAHSHLELVICFLEGKPLRLKGREVRGGPMKIIEYFRRMGRARDRTVQLLDATVQGIDNQSRLLNEKLGQLIVGMNSQSQ